MHRKTPSVVEDASGIKELLAAVGVGWILLYISQNPLEIKKANPVKWICPY